MNRSLYFSIITLSIAFGIFLSVSAVSNAQNYSPDGSIVLTSSSSPIGLGFVDNEYLHYDESTGELFVKNLVYETLTSVASSTSGGGDSDSNQTLHINSVSEVEGDSGTKVMSFTVTLDRIDSQTVTVDYATSDTGADDTATAGSDYVATSGSLTFTSGETSKTVSVTINGDTTVELDEAYHVALSNPVNAVIGTSPGIGTITNDDFSGGGNDGR